MGCKIHFETGNLIPLLLSVSAAVCFWHAFRGLPGSDGQGRDSLAGGKHSLLPAIALTLSGLGFRFHVLDCRCGGALSGRSLMPMECLAKAFPRLGPHGD
jgi:hypothetical protein